MRHFDVQVSFYHITVCVFGLFRLIKLLSDENFGFVRLLVEQCCMMVPSLR